MGGTWLALNGRSKFAILQNIFKPNKRANTISKGQLVKNVVKGDTLTPKYMQGLQDVYNGFKLITIIMWSVSIGYL